MYNDEIIHLIGGIHDFIGKFDQTPHPMGEGWYRIKTPCLTFLKEDAVNKRMTTVVSRLTGPDGKNYRNFVDVYIPDSAHMEIRVLNKSGQLHEVYQGEIDRKPSKLIVVPNTVIKSG